MAKLIIEKKSEDVNALAEKFKSAKTILALDYLGLTVEQFTDLRNKLRQADCEIKVYKNNIARRAAIVAGFDQFDSYFVGPKAVVISNSDIIAPAKVAYEFSLKNKKVQLNGGVIDGSVSTPAQMCELATLPSYEGLLTMLAAGMMSTVTELGIALNLYQEQL